MDKRKVIAAYRSGFITIQECAQILGLDSGQVSDLIDDPYFTLEPSVFRNKRRIAADR